MADCQCGHAIKLHNETGCRVTVERNPYESWLCRCSLPHGTPPSDARALMRLSVKQRGEIMRAAAERLMADGQGYENLWEDGDGI